MIITARLPIVLSCIILYKYWSCKTAFLDGIFFVIANVTCQIFDNLWVRLRLKRSRSALCDARSGGELPPFLSAGWRAPSKRWWGKSWRVVGEAAADADGDRREAAESVQGGSRSQRGALAHDRAVQENGEAVANGSGAAARPPCCPVKRVCCVRETGHTCPIECLECAWDSLAFRACLYYFYFIIAEKRNYGRGGEGGGGA